MTPYAIARTLSVMTFLTACTIMPASGSTASASPPRAASAAAFWRHCPPASASAAIRRKLDKHGNSVRGIDVLRGAVLALRSAHAQPQRRRAQRGHRRLRHRQEPVTPRPPSAGARHPRRARAGGAGHRAGRHAVALGGRLCSRRLAERPRPQFVDLRSPPCDLHHASRRAADRGGLRGPRRAQRHGGDIGVRRASKEWNTAAGMDRGAEERRATSTCSTPRSNGPKTRSSTAMAGSIDFHETTELSEQPLLDGLSAARADGSRLDLHDQNLSVRRKIHSRRAILPDALFFLRSGAVHVTLPDGVRLATLTAAWPSARWRYRDRPLRRRGRRHGRDALKSRCDFERFRRHPAAPPSASCATSRSSWPIA